MRSQDIRWLFGGLVGRFSGLCIMGKQDREVTASPLPPCPPDCVSFQAVIYGTWNHNEDKWSVFTQSGRLE